MVIRAVRAGSVIVNTNHANESEAIRAEIENTNLVSEFMGLFVRDWRADGKTKPSLFRLKSGKQMANMHYLQTGEISVSYL